jgi:hypothetical protein
LSIASNDAQIQFLSKDSALMHAQESLVALAQILFNGFPLGFGHLFDSYFSSLIHSEAGVK